MMKRFKRRQRRVRVEPDPRGTLVLPTADPEVALKALVTGSYNDVSMDEYGPLDWSLDFYRLVQSTDEGVALYYSNDQSWTLQVGKDSFNGRSPYRAIQLAYKRL